MSKILILIVKSIICVGGFAQAATNFAMATPPKACNPNISQPFTVGGRCYASKDCTGRYVSIKSRIEEGCPDGLDNSFLIVGEDGPDCCMQGN